jgi:heterodisulfide reductase subunit B
MKVAYYKGCLASLSAKELDSSTQALAPKLAAAPATSTRPSRTTTCT